MAEQPFPIDVLKNNPIITLGGKPDSGMSGRTIYLKDPTKYTIDGKPLEEFQLLGKGVVTDTGITSARINALVYKGKAPYYRDELLPDRPAGESILWKTIGAVTMVDSKGKKIPIPRNELRLGKPKDQTEPIGQPVAPGFDEQFADDENLPEIKPLSKKDSPSSTPTQPEARATGARYVNTEAVNREALDKDTHFQEVLTKMRDVLQEIKTLRKDLNDLTVLPAIAEQIREAGVWSDPTKAREHHYQALMAAMDSRGLKSDEALLASEYLLDQANRRSNEMAISQWTQKMQANGDTKDIRRSILDMVEHSTEGSIAFSKDAVEMSMTKKDRNAGYQDLRAAQITSDYLLDTYDSKARSRWIKDGKMTPDGMRERQEYHTFLAQMLRGEVPVGKEGLATKLRAKFDELRRLSPNEAIEKYQGLIPGDKTRTTASVKRWREKHGVEPYRAADLDLMATKGLLLIERRGTYPELHETTDIFYKKAMKESGARPTPAAGPATTIPEIPPPTPPTIETLPSAIPAAPDKPTVATSASADKIAETKPPTTDKPGEPTNPPAQQEIPPPKTGEVPKFEKVQAAHVAVKGDIKKDQDVAALEARLIARQAMEEHEKQYNPKGIKEWLATTASRIWKHNWWESMYNARERVHALLAQEQAGMEGIPLPLKYELRKKALEEAGRRVEARQATSGHRNLERFKNWWSDAEGYFTQEHKESLTILGEWKAELAKLDDRTVPQAEKDRIMANNPLHEARLASWNQSYKIADNIAKNIIHGERGEQKFTETLLLAKDSPVGRRLLDEVAKPYWAGLDSHGDVGLSEAQAREKLDEVFVSKEFTTLLSTLPADKQALLASRSYASTLIETFKGIHEQVRAATDHQEALKRLDFDIELTLGVAEYGARNKVKAMWGEERSRKNKELLGKLRRRDPLFSAAVLAPAGHRAELMAEIGNDALRNEMLWAVPASLGTMFVTRGIASTTAKVLAPLGVGGFMGGIIGGHKEWVRLGKEYKLHNLETALGYAFPQTYEQRRFLFAGDVVNKNTRRGEMEQRSYHQRSMTELMSRMEAIAMENGTMKGAITDPGQARELLSLLIDTEARNRLSDRRDINLLKVNDDDPTAPHVPFEAQKRDLDRIAAQSKSLLGTSPALDLAPLQAPGQTKDFAGVFDELVELHYGALEKEAGIMDARYQTALGTLSVAQGQSMERRDKDFKKFRILRTAVVAGKTAAFGAATGAVMREAYGLAESTIQLANTGQWQWHGPVSVGIGNLVEKFAPGKLGGALPLAPDAEMVQGGIMHFSQGVHMQGNNLVFDDSRGHVRELIKNFSPHFDGNGQLTQESIDQLKAAGVTFDHAQAFSHVVSSGTNPLDIGGHEYIVPKEMHWISDGAGGKSLVLEGLHDKAGNVIPPVMIVEHAQFVAGKLQNPQDVLNAIRGNNWLEQIPGGAHVAPVIDSLPDGVVQIPDAAGALHEIHALIPPGTHLVQTGNNVFNLISDKDKDILLHGLKLDPNDGHITNLALLKNDINLHNLNVTEHPLSPIDIPGKEGPGSSGSFDWRVGDMGDEKGFHGPWGGLEDPTLAKIITGDTTLTHPNADTNALKNVWRGLFENYYKADEKVTGTFGWQVPGQHVEYKAMQADTVFHDIPRQLFGGNQVTEPDQFAAKILEVSRLSEEAIEQHNQGIPLDRVHQILYEIGYQGRGPATKDEIQFLIENLNGPNIPGGSITPIQVVITQGGIEFGVKGDILENVLTYGKPGGPFGPIPPFPVVPIIGRRPLEAPGTGQPKPPMPMIPEEEEKKGKEKKIDRTKTHPTTSAVPEEIAQIAKQIEDLRKQQSPLPPAGPQPQNTSQPLSPGPIPPLSIQTTQVPDHMNDFDPKLPDSERKDILATMMPPELKTDAEKAAWLAGHNKNVALSTFIQSERDRLHREGGRDWQSDTGWDKKWLTSSEMSEIAGRYKIPMAFMIRGAHAVVLTRPPEKQPDGTYNVYHYNPFNDGEQVWKIKLENDANGYPKQEDTIYFSESVFPNSGIGTSNYENAVNLLTTAKYDLRIPTIVGKEWLTKAKEALKQEDGFNCTLWSIFHAAIANAMQPGDSEFKREGLPKIALDTGLRILRYEDIVGLTPTEAGSKDDLHEAIAQIANPQHAATNEDAFNHTTFLEDGHTIKRWFVVDGSGGSIDQSDPHRSEKIQQVSQQMALAASLTSINPTPKNVLIDADKRGRTLEGYGTALCADINTDTGEVKIAHAGDAAALRWRASPYASKRHYDTTSGPGNLQLITEQHNLAERLRQKGQLKTMHLEGPESSSIYRAIGDSTKPEADVANNIVETNLTLSPDEYLILASDGARIGDLLTDGSAYQVRFNEIMNELHAGKLAVKEASQQIAEAAKKQAEAAGNDYDDITIVIAKRISAVTPESHPPKKYKRVRKQPVL